MSAPRSMALWIAAGVVAGALVILGLVQQLALAPAADLDNKALALERKIAKASKDIQSLEPQIVRRMGDLRGQTFGADANVVSEAMRARLMGLLAPSGMNAAQFNSTPVSPQRISRKTTDQEVSRNINIRAGKLTHAINLLYLLASEPYLHRIDSLILKPSSQAGRVDLQFRYSTLAMAAAKGAHPASAASTQLAAGSLDTHEREIFKIIEERDIFRPYVKRPDPPPPPPVPTVGTPPPPPPPPPPPDPREGWRLAGLSTLFGIDVVHVRNRASGETRAHKIGDTLLDGKIVMIDCRELPRHDNPRAYSSGRVILQVKDTYWAVEQGDRLTDKRRLSPADLPSELRVPSTAPAVGMTSRGDGKP